MRKCGSLYNLMVDFPLPHCSPSKIAQMYFVFLVFVSLHYIDICVGVNIYDKNIELIKSSIFINN